ncbi:hypothetical protein BFC17_10650 [Alteromonas lipolytica]|uniref:Phage shock protein PspC N-terminal domain-containing protein n=2 Tax=Alteromonas lipolytica TaxID=1856405 RepID=A0A1E8FIX7_9ALTE|nr:hypothetical protein BFC17_10650 [Alteromonas lipolytica]
MIAGVCAGLAEHYHLRKNGPRFVFVLFSCFFAIPVLIYCVLWLILPQETLLHSVRADVQRRANSIRR